MDSLGLTDASLEAIRDILMRAAKQEILPRRINPERIHKRDGSVLTAADIGAQRFIRTQLEARWPHFQFLSEEMEAPEQQALLENSEAILWCLDPLDGTSNFVAGVPFFAISLALLAAGKPVFGMIYDPMREECFSAKQGEGAWLNGKPLCAPASDLLLEHCLAIIDFKRLPPELAVRIVREPPYGSQRSFGSVALDWCWIAAGRVHIYLHGGQRIWDFAAGSLILQEAKGFSMDLDGQPVFRASLAPSSAIAATDRRLFKNWVEWLGIPL